MGVTPTPLRRRVLSWTEFEVWDLWKPPTRQDVGLAGDQHLASFETSEPRAVEIHLPDGVTLTGDFQLITFNDLARLRSADSDPSTMDVTTQPLSIPQAHQVFGTWRRQLGLPETQADEWRQRVEAPEGTQNGTGLVIKGVTRRWLAT